MTDAAPFFADLAGDGGRAVWLRAADGPRLRAGLWSGQGRGTVLLFPGRTEFIEKYGPAAAELAARGYGTLSIDWRGQGLADRLLPDRRKGHVGSFADYQLDVQALLAFARAEGLPGPFHLMAHSLGGCIGLRALLRGLPVRAVAFSAPMWGIALPPVKRAIGHVSALLSRLPGQAGRYAPRCGPEAYVVEAPFAGNALTTDPEVYRWMRDQVTAEPDLALGGPTAGWLDAALVECRALARLPSPALPAACFLGVGERIVDPGAIRRRMAEWPGGTLTMLPEAEHEVMMERPATRARFYEGAAALFDAQG